MNVRYLGTNVQLADRRGPWKFTNGAENSVLQALQFQKVGICHKFPACQA
jgi:hypothetical protein